MRSQGCRLLAISIALLAVFTSFTCNAATASGKIIDIYFDEYNTAVLELEGTGTVWIGCTSVLFGDDDSIIREIDWEPKQVKFNSNGEAIVKFYNAEFWTPTMSQWITWWFDERVGFVFAVWEDKLTAALYRLKYKTWTLPEAFKNTQKDYIMDGLLSQKWVVDTDGYLLYKTY